MIRRVAAVVVTFCALISSARADLYTVAFEDMPLTVVGSGIHGDPFTLSVFASEVIGPSSPNYAGQVGILSVPGVRFAVDFYPFERVNFDVTSVSATFATGTSGAIDWAGVFGDFQGAYDASPDWTWQADTTGAVTTLTYTPASGPLIVGSMGIMELAGNGAQLLSITLDAAIDPIPPAPEPSAALPCVLAGIAGIVAAGRRRARATRQLAT